jgi:hypothetical protein
LTSFGNFGTCNPLVRTWFIIREVKGSIPNIFNLYTCSQGIVVTYEIRVFFKGAQKEVFSSILKYAEQAELKLCPNL